MSHESTEILWQFTFEEGANIEAVSAELQRRLAQLDVVEEAEVSPPEEERFLAEAGVLLATAVVVVRGSRELTEELTKLIRAVRELVGEVRGVRGAVVDLEGERIPVEQADPARIAKAAAS